MPRAITREQVERILAAPADETLESTAARVGVGKSTVSSVLRNPSRYLNRTAPKGKRELPERCAKNAHFSTTVPERCPGCGGKALMPCEYCRQEAARESERKGR